MVKNNQNTMHLWEHLEELRWTFFKIIGILLVMMVAAFFFVDDLLEILLWPVKTIQDKNPDIVLRQILTGPFDAVIIKMKTSFLAALIVSFPIVLYFIWLFIRPGMKKNENTAIIWICIPGTLSFIIGIVLGYLLIAPVLSVLLSFSMSSAENYWTVKNLINFIFFWLLGAGLIFELPLAIFVLTKLGIIEVALLKKIRPYFIIFAFIIAAIITPPDPFTMLIVGIPLIFLYELGIFIASLKSKKSDESLDTDQLND